MVKSEFGLPPFRPEHNNKRDARMNSTRFRSGRIAVALLLLSGLSLSACAKSGEGGRVRRRKRLL